MIDVVKQFVWDMFLLTDKNSNSITLEYSDGTKEVITNNKLVSLFKDIEVGHYVGILVDYDFTTIPGTIRDIKEVKDKGLPLPKETLDEFLQDSRKSSK